MTMFHSTFLRSCIGKRKYKWGVGNTVLTRCEQARGVPLKLYLCGYCDFYHLTKDKERTHIVGFDYTQQRADGLVHPPAGGAAGTRTAEPGSHRLPHDEPRGAEGEELEYPAQRDGADLGGSRDAQGSGAGQEPPRGLPVLAPAGQHSNGSERDPRQIKAIGYIPISRENDEAVVRGIIKKSTEAMILQDIARRAKSRWHCSVSEATGRVRVALVSLIRAKVIKSDELLRFTIL